MLQGRPSRAGGRARLDYQAVLEWAPDIVVDGLDVRRKAPTRREAGARFAAKRDLRSVAAELALDLVEPVEMSAKDASAE
jgi:hypothetical protein